MAGTTKVKTDGARNKAVKGAAVSAKATYARSHKLSGKRAEFFGKHEDDARR